MTHRRWLRILPVAFVMYTISYVDRTNISLALEPMKSALGMDSELAGLATGIFFFGYVSLQIPGGHFAHRWSAKWLISIFLVFWGLCAVGGGLVQTPNQFLGMRFLLGVAESAVYPATLVLVANWFP
ncbi:MAG: MFS transporter, partial [Verrucomicrobia bacterium]|nr:MFS transporter [Verrucomicrobiota bacterium]